MPGLLNQIPAWIERLRGISYEHPDRQRRRIHRAGLTGLATLFSRGVTVLVSLATLPLTSHYLGKERFGLWLTLSSFMAWIVIADLGIAVSLINVLSSADGRDDRTTARRAVTSAFWMTTAIAGVVILAGLSILPWIDWAGLFNLKTSLAAAEAGPSVAALIVLCALRLPSSIIGCTYQAYQEGYIYQLWSGLGGVFSAGCLILAVILQAGLTWLVAAYLGGLLLTDLISGAFLFFHRRRWLLPDFSSFDYGQAIRLIRKGSLFWIAQVSAIFMLQIDLLLVSRLFGASEAATYGTALRLYLIIGAVQTAFIAPLWAAYGEALARRDFDWIVRTFRQTIKISLITIVPAGMLICMTMSFTFKILVTDDIMAGIDLRIALFLSEVCNSVARCISTFMNGIGDIRTQAVFGPVGAVLNIILSIYLGRLLGLSGVAFATAACLMVVWIIIIGSDANRRIMEFNARRLQVKI